MVAGDVPAPPAHPGQCGGGDLGPVLRGIPRAILRGGRYRVPAGNDPPRLEGEFQLINLAAVVVLAVAAVLPVAMLPCGRGADHGWCCWPCAGS